ncbi:MAG TPA: hypothetical protein VFA71_12200 [Terriglobales bacterium]|nr:hypothetical protein [Terriglobales bacterium]
MAYNILDLGVLHGDFSHATAINNCEQVVGWTGNPASPNNPASPAPFIWAQGLMLNLPLPAPEKYGRAFDINDFQQVVGFSDNLVADKSVTWINGVFQHVFFPGDGANARSVSNCGFIAGEGGPPPGNTHGFSNQNGVILLPPLPPTPPNVLPSDRYTRAYCINNHGQVVGGTDTGNPIFFPKAYAPPVPGIHACMWDNGLVVDLGTLNAGEGSEAYGINDNHQIVGRSGNNAVLWHNGVKTNLGPGAAFNINNQGVVVGDSFIWHNGAHTPLAALLPPGSGWTNLTGADINDQGRIVGSGTIGGQTHAFLMWQ